MEHFDHFAYSHGTRIGNWITLLAKKRIFQVMEPYVNKDSCILEIGPGRGETAHIFLSHGYRNYAVAEPNSTMRAALENQGLTVKNYSAPHLKEDDSTFDVIILEDMFEHLDTIGSVQLLMKEARRVLRPGGFLCIISPDYLHWKEDFFHCDYSHSNITTVRRTMQLLNNHDFSTCTYRYLSAFFHGAAATAVSRIVRIVTYPCSGNGLDKKIYKLKLTFLRRFIIIGSKR